MSVKCLPCDPFVIKVNRFVNLSNFKICKHNYSIDSFSNFCFNLTLQVQRSLNDRLQNFDNIDNLPSAPHDLDGDDEDGGSGNLYPSLHNLPTMPR